MCRAKIDSQGPRNVPCTEGRRVTSVTVAQLHVDGTMPQIPTATVIIAR